MAVKKAHTRKSDFTHKEEVKGGKHSHEHHAKMHEHHKEKVDHHKEKAAHHKKMMKHHKEK